MYCGRLIATNPNLFAGILKIRVGYVCYLYIQDTNVYNCNLISDLILPCSWILHAIRLYLTIPTGLEPVDEDGKPEPLENRSPSEIRRLLLRVLNLKTLVAEDKLFGLQ